MANISKITLPNGTSYDIKDATARATGKVSGVKGERESNYRVGNVNITPENIGAYKKKEYERGTLDVGIRPLIESTRANRLAFLPADQVIIETTIDGGLTWESANIADITKTGFFATSGAVYIPLLNSQKSALCGVRFTITGMKYDVPQGTLETEKYNFWNENYVLSQQRYFNVREWWFLISANNDTIKPQIYCASGKSPNSWVTCFNKDFRMTGWPGSDWVRAGEGKTFGGSTNQTGNYWNWRLIFWSRMADGKTSFQSNTKQAISKIKCFGDNVWGSSNNLAANDHLYSWDYAKNASFPAQVQASVFKGSGSLLTNLNGSNISTGTVAAARIADLDASKITTGTLPFARGGTGQTTAQAASNSFLNALSTESATPLDADYFISQYAGGGTTTTTYHRKPVSALWEYIKNKISSVLGLTVTNYNGSAAKVNNHTVESDVPSNAVFTDTTYQEATISTSGLLSSSDKIIIDGINSTYATKTESSNHVVASETQPSNQQAGDIWLVLSQ